MFGQITFIALYEDPATNDVVDELVINPGFTFFGLLFERLVSITNPNVIVDDISNLLHLQSCMIPLRE